MSIISAKEVKQKVVDFNNNRLTDEWNVFLVKVNEKINASIKAGSYAVSFDTQYTYQGNTYTLSKDNITKLVSLLESKGYYVVYKKDSISMNWECL